MTPFSLRLYHRNAMLITRVTAKSTPIPNGHRFVVEHLSGCFSVGTGWPVRNIWATDGGFGQEVYLPTHFESDELNLGVPFGIIRVHQFGSPVRMYVDAGRSVTISGDANIAAEILAVAVGQLVPMS
jgi:hypothetical protein